MNTDNKENLNFENEIDSLYQKIEWSNSSLISRLKRLFKINSGVVMLGSSDKANEFKLKYPIFAKEIKNLTIASYIIDQDIKKSPVEKVLALNLKTNFSPNFLQILQSHIYLLHPYSLKYFINLKWDEYIALIYSRYNEENYAEQLSLRIIEIAYCATRAIYSYHLFCLAMLKMNKLNIEKENLDFMRVYLECINHAEMNLVLNRAIIDKTLESYAYIAGVDVNGKGELNKKITKISNTIKIGHPMFSHWSAFVQVAQSDQFTNLNNYRTGLVHKFSPKSTAFHKNSFDGIQKSLRAVESLIKEANHMSFFGNMSLLFTVNEDIITNTINQH